MSNDQNENTPSPLQRARDELALLDREEKRAEGELSQIRGRKAEIAGFINLFEHFTRPVASKPSLAGVGAPLKPRLIQQVTSYLKSAPARNTGPIFMPEIIEVLHMLDLLPGGKNPKQQVASILGRAGQFDYDHVRGWTLKGADSAPASSEDRTLM